MARRNVEPVFVVASGAYLSRGSGSSSFERPEYPDEEYDDELDEPDDPQELDGELELEDPHERDEPELQELEPEDPDEDQELPDERLEPDDPQLPPPKLAPERCASVGRASPKTKRTIEKDRTIRETVPAATCSHEPASGEGTAVKASSWFPRQRRNPTRR